MENQDKIYEQFKDAAGRAEEKGFDRMEAVWNRVEEKLDNNKQRRIATWWKYTGIAALFLLFMTVGFFTLNDNNAITAPETTPENNITVIDTQKVNEAFDSEKSAENDAMVVNEAENVPKNEAAIPSSSADSTTFINGARFSRSININNPQYAFIAKKVELPSGGTVSGFASAEPSADTDTHTGYITFSGTVSDQTGPLPGATIIVTGTNKAVQTDVEGQFTVTLEEGKELSASFPGYQSKKTTANVSNNNTNIILEENRVLSESVAVDTYRSTKKVKTTAAATTLPIETIEDRANATVLHSLQGEAAGLTIGCGSGQPGSDSTIVLRGVGTINGNIAPLYVIDGIPVDEDGFRSIDQNDIESFQILKDATATSIYGNMGTNGVIIITTKGGLSKKELRKLKRENRRLEKQRKKAEHDSIKEVKVND